MSIRKRILPSGQVRWLCDYRDGGGARRFRQFRTKKEAEAFRDQTGVDVRAGVHTPDAVSATVKQAGELWLQRCELDGLERCTLTQYRIHLDRHILPLIGDVKLSRLTMPAVETFKDELLKTRSRVMARKVLVSLTALISEAQKVGLISQNCARGVRVKAASRHDKRVTIPTKDEIRAMLSKTSELWPVASPWRPIIITAIFSGLRASELRGLGWDCVDFDKKIIRVRRRADYWNRLGSPKSKAGMRDVPLAPMVINALKQWRIACPRSELGLVFCTARGCIISPAKLHQIWRELLDALDLDFRFHDLRHVAASLLIAEGWQPKRIQQVMGHANIQLTFNCYGHLWETPGEDAAAMAAIEKHLLGG